MEVFAQFVIEGGGHGSVKLMAGEAVCITNIEGSQVADLWAFCLPDTSEFLSTEHTRSCLQKLIPQQGDTLYSSQRCAMLTLEEDTSPGIHDMLLSACDAQRYELLGHKGYHKNCAENLTLAMAQANAPLTEIPSPVNLFERVEIGTDGSLQIEPPPVKAGQFVTLRAHMDLLVVISACPMDIALTNGPDKRSKPLDIQAIGKSE